MQGRYQSWKFVHDQGNQTLPQPVLTVYPSKASCILLDECIEETDIPQDSVADWPSVAGPIGTKNYITHWTTEVRQFSCAKLIILVVDFRPWLGPIGFISKIPTFSTRSLDNG